MPSSQNLVPTGGAYGTRQETVGLMQQAGLPLSVSAANSSPPAAPAPAGGAAPSGQPVAGAPAPALGLDLLLQHTPDEFGFIGQQAAESQPVGQPDSTSTALAGSAQSEFALAVLARLNQR